MTGRDLGNEWLHIVIAWPFVFVIGVGAIFGWRAWRISQGDMVDPSGLIMLWFFGSFFLAGLILFGPPPMDPEDYPYRR